MKPEEKVKLAVKRILKQYHVWYFMPAMGAYGRAGIPDFMCCVRGRLLAIETKAGKGKTTPLQEMEIERIKASEGIAVVINETHLLALNALVRALVAKPWGDVKLNEGEEDETTNLG